MNLEPESSIIFYENTCTISIYDIKIESENELITFIKNMLSTAYTMTELLSISYKVEGLNCNLKTINILSLCVIFNYADAIAFILSMISSDDLKLTSYDHLLKTNKNPLYECENPTIQLLLISRMNLSIENLCSIINTSAGCADKFTAIYIIAFYPQVINKLKIEIILCVLNWTINCNEFFNEDLLMDIFGTKINNNILQICVRFSNKFDKYNRSDGVCSLLDSACAKGYLRLAKLFVSLDAKIVRLVKCSSISKKPRILKNSIESAILSGNIDLIKFLSDKLNQNDMDILHNKLMLNNTIKTNLNILKNAIQSCNVSILKLLIEKQIILIDSLNINHYDYYTYLAEIKKTNYVNKISMLKYIERLTKIRINSKIFKIFLQNCNNNNTHIIKYIANTYIKFNDPYENYNYLEAFSLTKYNTDDDTNTNDILNMIRYQEQEYLINYLYSKIGSNFKVPTKKYTKLFHSNIFNWDIRIIDLFFEKFKFTTNNVDDISVGLALYASLKSIIIHYFSVDTDNTNQFKHVINLYIKYGSDTDRYENMPLITEMINCVYINDDQFILDYIKIMLESGFKFSLMFDEYCLSGYNRFVTIDNITEIIDEYISNLIIEKKYETIYDQYFGLEIKNLEIKYNVITTNNNLDDMICTICYDQFNLMTNCTHKYCHECFMKLLIKNSICAMCRRPIEKLIYILY